MQPISTTEVQSALIEFEDVVKTPASPAFFPVIIERVIDGVSYLIETGNLESPATARIVAALKNATLADVADPHDVHAITSRAMLLRDVLQKACERCSTFNPNEVRFVRNVLYGLLYQPCHS